MCSTFYIKPASSLDIEKLINLRAFLLDDGFSNYASSNTEDSTAWKNSYRMWLQVLFANSFSKKIVFGAYNQDDLIGCSTGLIDERAPSTGSLNGLTGWIQSVVVEPTWRRKGVGDKLIAFQLNWFRNNRVTKVFLQSTNNAISFYKKAGWQETGETLFYKQID
ncbi:MULTISPECIES: GNAT family N-acetyltransferase [unclassified Bartonella]|uniref:GNAT family N-acetyltransferase n=1 Tax=unclassified Bartonella TaxID=2645622 RepID=UPI0035CF0139